MPDLKDDSMAVIQRSELHRKIWAIADDVRGAVDGWDFKQYILCILFYRFISENITEFFNSAEHEAGDLELDYSEISDEEAERDFRSVTIKDNENLNTDLANIFKAIEGSSVVYPSEYDIEGLLKT